jgi:hypothetical protein
MSIQSNFPAIKPTLLLDFANVEQLDPRVTFARASTATYYGTQTAKAEENLLVQSQDFLTTWGQNRTVRNANTDVAPDGTTTADSVLQAAGQTTAGNVQQNITSVVGDYAVSIFAKPNGRNFSVIREQLLDGTNNDTWFDVQNGTVGTTDAGHTATITASTNSYYRCSIKFTANAVRAGNIAFYIADANGSITVADDGNGLYFWGAQMEQRSAVTAYTPTTTQTITNYISVLQTAASGVARFDHNPITDESLGLLIEEQRTNLMTYSEQFDNAAWNKSRSSITANTIVAPDGMLTGDKFVENTDNNSHFFTTVSTAILNATTYAFSVYAKASERSVLQLSVGGFVFNNLFVNFDLSNGTVSSISPSGITASITPVGNGWYRCVAVSTSIASSAGYGPLWVLQNSPTAARLATYQGDGFSGLFIWGAQLEAGAFPTSYIQTVASQVTRAADAASMTGANFSSWYNQAEGSAYTEAASLATAYNGTTVAFSDGTNSNRMIIRGMTTASQSLTLGILNNGTQWSLAFPSQTTSATKLALGYRVNDIAFTRNAATPLTDADAVLPVVNQLRIGADGDGSVIYNGTIRKVAYYPLRVTNAQLQALTS